MYIDNCKRVSFFVIDWLILFFKVWEIVYVIYLLRRGDVFVFFDIFVNVWFYLLKVSCLVFIELNILYCDVWVVKYFDI